MVNRIWQHLFGTGIVPTPENFGVGGEAPTHSELLEWLSAEFMRGGWRIKPLIRQIVLSSVYRQSSQAETAAAAAGMAADPENRLLWRMRLKRLESEVIRDSVLAASGALDRTMGGRPVMLEARPDGMIVVAEKNQPGPTARLRRSAYLLARRAFQLSEMTVFDQPVVATSCPERTRSAVPLQSLAMLNGQFLWEQAEQLAGRMLSAAPEARDARIAATFARAIGRPPSDSETAAGAELIDRQTASYRAATPDMSPTEAERKAFVHFCHTLLNTSEFLYVP
jgi:hypothetical protein